MPQTCSCREMRPVVRFADFTHPSAVLARGITCALDSRLFFVQKGWVRVVLEGREYVLKSHGALLFRAGLPYRLDSCSADLELLAVNFDYLPNREHMKAALPISVWPPSEPLEDVVFSDCPALNETLFLESAPFAAAPLAEMRREYLGMRAYYRERTSSLLSALILQLARSTESDGAEGALDRVLECVRNHFAEELSNARVGEITHYHPNYLNRLMLTHTGATLHRYIVRYRVRRALDLLMTTDMPLMEIALRSGFQDQSHFTRVFHQETGMTPREARKITARASI